MYIILPFSLYSKLKNLFISICYLRLFFVYYEHFFEHLHEHVYEHLFTNTSLCTPSVRGRLIPTCRHSRTEDVRKEEVVKVFVKVFVEVFVDVSAEEFVTNKHKIIYSEREREREREQIHMYIYIYIYIYVYLSIYVYEKYV